MRNEKTEKKKKKIYIYIYAPRTIKLHKDLFSSTICAYIHGDAVIFTISGRKIQFSIQQTLT